MRIKLYITAAAIVSVNLLFAQKVKVEVTNQNIGGGRNDAFVTSIYYSDESTISKEWKAQLKQYSPEKVKSGSEILADNATIPSISANTIDIYARTKKSGDEVQLIVAFDLGGAFVNSSHSGAKSAERIVYDFAVRMTAAGLEEKVKVEEKVLAGQQKELEKLVKANDRLHQNIDRYKSEIETAKSNIEQAGSDIETNKKAQEDAAKQIEEQKKAVQSVADKLKDIK